MPVERIAVLEERVQALSARLASVQREQRATLRRLEVVERRDADADAVAKAAAASASRDARHERRLLALGGLLLTALNVLVAVLALTQGS